MRSNAISACDDLIWCRGDGKAQFGQEWIPKTVFGLDVGGIFKPENSQNNINALWWLCVIQLVIAALPSIIACCSKCCGDDSDRADKKARYVCFIIFLL